MNTELRIDKNLLLELQEAEKVDLAENEDGVYSITADFGGVLSIICC